MQNATETYFVDAIEEGSQWANAKFKLNIQWKKFLMFLFVLMSLKLK